MALAIFQLVNHEQPALTMRSHSTLLEYRLALKISMQRFHYQQRFALHLQTPMTALKASPFVLLLLVLPSNGPSAIASSHVAYSSKPAKSWQEAMISGNGRMGILVFGQPADEVVVFNHERLYEPLYDSPAPPPIVKHVIPEVRRLALAGQYDQARKLFDQAARDAGFQDLRWTDPYHPAMAMQIDQSVSGKMSDYRRSTDFRTGEVLVEWRDDNAAWQRRSFVSRPDNVVVQLLSSPADEDIRATCRLVNQDQRSDEAKNASYQPPVIKARENELLYRCKYRKSKRAYFALTRVIPLSGEVQVRNSTLQFAGKRLLLLTRVVSVEDCKNVDPLIQQTRSELNKLPGNYAELLRPHADKHGSIYDRVSLELGGSTYRKSSNESLIATQKATPQKVLPALLEKMFNMGRYSLICSSGEWPPNLMGIFNGEWQPKWSGDFTLDANVNLQIAAANICDLSEGTDSYHRLISGLASDWQVNARNLYGCRGLLSGCRTDGRHNLHTHHKLDGFPGFFWTAGAEWLVQPLYEHYLVTGDRRFAREKLLPLMKEVVAFYEDFLVERDGAGHYVFVPSYSPENHPENTNNPLAINATMDIACAREALTNLINVCLELEIEPETAKRCRALLDQLPPYLINDDGALKEWSWPTLDDRYNHRHVSHLYPVWPGHEINPEDTPKLFEAAKVAAEKRGRGNGSAHGLAHMALIGTRLKDAELVYGNLCYMLSNDYLLPSLFTYHNPNRIYNADMLHSLPAIVAEMLIYSKPNQIEILPALSDELRRGEIRGLHCRCQVTVDRLEWDLDAGRIITVLTSTKDQWVTLRVRRGIRSATVSATETVEILDSNQILLELKANRQIRLSLTLL